ncbi:MAG: hypothetical protein IT214_10500 [Chitinophagaceae bacterium]|jgi:hypothetical protein|nr:hypothetical protein [Chitinophagaceae bacterium]OQY95449.1 MAG: hypothetical protein B6D37_05510 [Sphingobacteriales bacterium UTBCD1]
MLLNIVTDDELFISQVVKSILMIILAGGIIFNLFRVIRASSAKKRIISVTITALLVFLILFVIKEYRIEAALLKNPVYVQGTTLGYCSVFAKGQGIEFEYELDGVKYHSCNTFYPVPKDSIVVPGGKYRVRCAEKFKSEGRMIFKRS